MSLKNKAGVLLWKLNTTNKSVNMKQMLNYILKAFLNSFDINDLSEFFKTSLFIFILKT